MTPLKLSRLKIFSAVFDDAKACGIELNTIVPNATQLIQALGKEVYYPLKKRRWLIVTRNSRKNTGSPFGKEIFAENIIFLICKPLIRLVFSNFGGYIMLTVQL